MTDRPHSDTKRNDAQKTGTQSDQHGRLHDAREAAENAYASTRARAKDGLRSATAGIDANPLGILVGGLAVGALAGALIPRSEREKQILAPLGQQLGQRARGALDAARDAGRTELADRGLNRDAAKDQVKSLFDNLVKVATSAGSAAAQSAKTGG